MKGEDFLTRNLASFTNFLESVFQMEEVYRRPGLLQKLDPRMKLVTFVCFIVTIGLARSYWVLAAMLGLVLALTLLSRVPLKYFLKRVLLFIPIFTLIIALPALFITPGEPLFHLGGSVAITTQGARSAGLLFLRVTDSLSFGTLIILTTPWTNLLVGLRRLRMPALIVDILGMTYRYIFLLLHTANSMFLARRSRSLGSFSGSENRRWLVRTLGTTLARSQHLSEEVYLAMQARGYQGEVHVLAALRLNRRDYIYGFLALVWVGFLLWRNSQ